MHFDPVRLTYIASCSYFTQCRCDSDLRGVLVVFFISRTNENIYFFAYQFHGKSKNNKIKWIQILTNSFAYINIFSQRGGGDTQGIRWPKIPLLVIIEHLDTGAGIYKLQLEILISFILPSIGIWTPNFNCEFRPQFEFFKIV